MVRRENEWPEEGELIVGTVHKVLNYGAFASLEEYPDKEAFIHISEVSAGWVKNIRDYVRENQKVVARVLRVNPKRGHVDVSMKRIREDQRTKKIQAWKIEQKAEKFLELAAKSLNKDLNTAYNEVGYLLIKSYGDLYGAFEASVEENSSSLVDEGISEEWTNAITEIAKNNITPPEVQITGYIDIKSYAPNGVEVIKKALKSAEKDNIVVQSVGAPRYRLIAKSHDYIQAEKDLKEAAEECISIVISSNGEGVFHREI